MSDELTTITQEQLCRSQENRRRALELKARLQSQPQFSTAKEGNIYLKTNGKTKNSIKDKEKIKDKLCLTSTTKKD
jgi:hypothetical protein